MLAYGIDLFIEFCVYERIAKHTKEQRVSVVYISFISFLNRSVGCLKS